ncbi:MAG: UPF0280 family protein [Syntrophomonadaceae bacterium]|nr:UPF0280 family protein [Syntrophomonadaceae bacterium]
MDVGKHDYVNRHYRLNHTGSDLSYFNIRVKDSDLAIGVAKEAYTDSLISLCQRELIRLRSGLEYYIEMQPDFKTTFLPIQLLPGAPDIARLMAGAGLLAGVGPMAAVAGAFAQTIGEYLNPYSAEVIVENGGDIYLRSSIPRTIAIFAGESSFSNQIALKVNPAGNSLGICTSSGTVGPSVSLGKADAVLIRAASAALADAVASRAGNQVQNENDLMKAVEAAREVPGVEGVLVIKNDKMAAWGDMELVPI